MKNILLTFAAIAAFFISSPEVSGQDYRNTPVEISSEKVRIDGKLYYSHKVLERQTLYSIAKTYDVSLDEIKAINPSLHSKGLIKGMMLLIPVKPEKVFDTGSESASVAQIQDDGQQKEPETVSQPTHRQDQQVRSFDDVDYFIHTVKWYESLSSIARKYHISEELIVEFNSLESTILRKRQKIKIPEDEFIPYIERMIAGKLPHQPEDIPLGTVNKDRDNPAMDENFQQETMIIEGKPGEIDIALILPFGCSPDGNGGNQNYFDFYSGALVAARTLAEHGVRINLSTIDSHEFSDCAEIARSPKIAKSDIVIGPVTSNDIMEFVSECRNKPVVSPLDQNAEKHVALHSNLLQAPVSAKDQQEDIAKWIKESAASEEKVLIIAESSGNPKEYKDISALLDTLGVRHNILTYNILQGRGVDSRISTYLDKQRVNHVIIASGKEAFVNDATRNINTLCTMQKFHILTYGTAKFRSFETIETEHFHNTGMSLSMNYYVDYDSPETMRFLRTYRALFNTEPTPFAFQGYDMMKYFTMAALYIREHGGSFENVPLMHLLQSDIKFEKTPDGGYVNTAARRIRFSKNYQIRIVR